MKNFWGEMPEDEYYASQGVKNTQEFFDTPQGKLFTHSWLPVDRTPKAVVCFTHGYGSDSAWTFQLLPIALAQHGYAAYAADMPGHGRSWGLPAYVEDFPTAAASLLCFYKSVRARKENEGLRGFLFGESMGGCMTLLMHFQDLKGWDGIILSAPLITIAGAMTVPWAYMTSFKLLSPLIGTWAIVPGANGVPNVNKDPVKAQLIKSNPRRYTAAPRVRTRLEMDRMVEFMHQNLGKVSVPFLVMHGTDDNVTDPSGSQKLYDTAASADKTIRLYQGAYHSLLQGDFDENRDKVVSDIKTWLDARSS